MRRSFLLAVYLPILPIMAVQVASAMTITDLELTAEGTVTVDAMTGSFVSTSNAITLQEPGYDFVSHKCMGSVTSGMGTNFLETAGTIVWSGPSGDLFATFIGSIAVDQDTGIGLGGGSFTITGGTDSFFNASGFGVFVASNEPFLDDTAVSVHMFAAVPEPSAIMLLCLGSVGISGYAGRNRHRWPTD